MYKFGHVPVPNDSLINMYNTLGYTMLHYAIMYKRMECITTLIELGAGKDIKLHPINEVFVAVCVYSLYT